ncbi:clathrin associated protein complex large subunit [Entophlyctis luteolus]|nr:clathrin associated protein complex large subunit [Entophlyctis luteolus]
MADERAVIAKESAFIRTAIREETVETRYYNVQKLLYIHMLGYPAHFGQIECIKLAASHKLAEKRLGYLGVMMLLDETQETLTLVTNCLQNDMNSSNVFIAALALTTLGNIASPEISRDLCGDVEKMLGSTNSYVRKKAALCAIRIVKKVPDLAENFVERSRSMLLERAESSLLTGISLAIEVCKAAPELVSEFKEQVPVLVKHLKNLVTTGFNAEFEVSGVPDPFLQAKILSFLRILGTHDPRASEIMNDILAQVATTTDSSKNVGNSVLYEVVRTIMSIEAEQAVKVVAINILAKFLESPDSNARYIALTTLARHATSSSSLLLSTAADSTTSLHRHRATILACLHDSDTTLRAKAADLAFCIVTRDNAAALIKDLLVHLEREFGAGPEIRGALARRIVDCAAKYRINPAWEVLVNLRVLQLAGDAGRGSGMDIVMFNFVKVISVASEDLQVVAARRLFWSVKNGGDLISEKEWYLIAAVWCSGEFGDLIVDSDFVGVQVEGVAQIVGGDVGEEIVFATAPTEADVVAFLEGLLKGHFSSVVVKAFTLMALIKLSVRFADATALQHIKSLIGKYQPNVEVDIQTRAVEFGAILSLDSEAKYGLLERMPVLDSSLKEEEAKGPSSDTPFESAKILASAPSQVSSAVQDLLDLNFDIDTTSTIVPKTQNFTELFGGISLVAGGASSENGSKPDLLSDLFAALPTSLPQASQDVPTSLDALAGLHHEATIDPVKSPVAAKSRILCFDKASLQIYLVPTHSKKDGAELIDVAVAFENTGFAAVTNLSFQVAVPKSLRLKMNPPSSTFIPPSGTATQSMAIENPTNVNKLFVVALLKFPFYQAAVKLRLKIGFLAGNEKVQEIVEFADL